MLMFRCLGLLLLATSSIVSGCAAAPDGTGEPTPGSSQDEIKLGDRTHACFPNVPTPVACDHHDGVAQYTSGNCTIYVEQQCEFIQDTCCCKARVVDTTGPCDGKDWSDFHP